MKKFNNKIKKINDVAAWRLCVGCGACVPVCPDKKVKLLDIYHDGIRPFINTEECDTCSDCIEVCPGINYSHEQNEKETSILRGLQKKFGPILEIFEGYATDKALRYAGSSGGAASALSLYCLEKLHMYGVLHIGADTKYPWRNTTILSKNRNELLRNTGSRYSPASPCDGLDKILAAPQPSVFIGKPCDIKALRNVQMKNRELLNKTGVAIGIFCAGTPSTDATLDLLKKHDITIDSLAELRYRGNGWPGNTTVRQKGEKEPSISLTYYDSWGFLNNYRPFRCYLCPDGTAEFADISCGDPWYREPKENEDGYSLVIVRTDKGRKIVHDAMNAGYITLKRVPPQTAEQSQRNLLRKRGAIAGRLFTMKLFGLPTPELKGFSLSVNWLSLPLLDKIRSVFGTARRIIQRRYFRPIKY